MTHQADDLQEGELRNGYGDAGHRFGGSESDRLAKGSRNVMSVETPEIGEYHRDRVRSCVTPPAPVQPQMHDAKPTPPRVDGQRDIAVGSGLHGVVDSALGNSQGASQESHDTILSWSD